MPLTPAEVHNVAFNKPPIGKRGYNEDEVDQFLDIVEDTLAQLMDENEFLRQRVEELEAGGTPAAATAAPSVDEGQLRKEIEAKVRGEYEAKLAEAKKATAKAEADVKAAREEAERARKEAAPAEVKQGLVQQPADSGVATADTHMQAAKVLGLAQEMADRLTSEAQAESKSMLDEARSAAEKQVNEANSKSQATLADAKQRAEKQLSEAEQKAKTMVADAERHSEKTINEANERAQAQVKEAQEKAQALQADAEKKHTEIMATVKQQQSALEARIAELRTFEREYRTRLKTLLQSQLEELESRGSSAPNANPER